MTDALRKLAILLAFCAAPVLALASGGEGALEPAATQVKDIASLQRGAGLFMNYCVSCHSAKFMRYSRIAADLGLTEEQVMQNLNFTGAKFGETVEVAMTTAEGEQWFGKAPPDLSLTARARGVDWIYNYLKGFYADESAPSGWNNTLLPNASMPHVLWELQGVQAAVSEKDEHTGVTSVVKLELAKPGTLTPQQYNAAARDITAFMQYVAEPAVLKRQGIGLWVILYLGLFTFIAWLLKHEYWRDVH
jgi:ubiquinol-cytochrome c reductase cytochrome c1 subunit